MTDAQDLLMGGGGKSWSWAIKNEATGGYDDKPPGTSVEGYIDGPIGDPIQQTDIHSGALQTWPDGKPKLQIVIPLATQLREDTEDDGKRGLFVKQSSNLQAAVRDAVKNAGAQSLQQGGYLKVTFTGPRPASQVGMNPVKVFEAAYTPPAQGVVMDTGQAVTQPAQSPAQYAPQQGHVPTPQPPPAQVSQTVPAQQYQQQAPTPAPVQGQPDPYEIAKKLLHELKLSPEQVAASTGLSLEQVQQLPPF